MNLSFILSGDSRRRQLLTKSSKKKKKKKIRRHLSKLQISYARPLNGAEAAATHTICKMHYVLVLKKKKEVTLGTSHFELYVLTRRRVGRYDDK